MKERKISDYLHFYLGSKMERGGIVTGALLDAAKEAAFDVWSDFKPILRPLSDMAYEEFVEAGKIHISEGGTIAVTFEEVRSNTVLPMRPKTFVYLLSKGFDLFNLIESGLAINKTTPKP